MLVEPAELLSALRLPAACEVDVEPQGVSPWAAERVTIRQPEAQQRVVILRGDAVPEHAINHIAVLEALTRTGFSSAPKLLAVIGDIAVEEEVDGASALALVPPPGAAAAAIRALAGLHGLSIREGMGWGRDPGHLIPEDEVPLHRLGFAAPERELARMPLADLRRDLLGSPFGFVHGDASAENILLARDHAWLIDFGRAGYGCQFFDVAAFLLTCGLDAPARRVLALGYGARRGFDPEATADLIDGAGIFWGVSELLKLPRRQIQAMGDDAASEALKTAATRIERGIRASAGILESAAAIRRALWPE